MLIVRISVYVDVLMFMFCDDCVDASAIALQSLFRRCVGAISVAFVSSSPLSFSQRFLAHVGFANIYYRF